MGQNRTPELNSLEFYYVELKPSGKLSALVPTLLGTALWYVPVYKTIIQTSEKQSSLSVKRRTLVC